MLKFKVIPKYPQVRIGDVIRVQDYGEYYVTGKSKHGEFIMGRSLKPNSNGSIVNLYPVSQEQELFNRGTIEILSPAFAHSISM